MNYTEIEKVVCSILAETFHISDELLIPENFVIPLTGKLFQFDDISLAYLFLELERAFNIHIPGEAIINYEFNTIQGITNLVHKINGH